MIRSLGIDTSNYTTSTAVYQDGTGMNAGRLLDVPEGALGLRQSNALFSHVKQLPEQFDHLHKAGMLDGICAVGASTRPRAVEGSYMPCFLVGASQGQVIASVLDVPFYAFSHQQGHIAAAAWSSGHMELLDQPHLAWHLSGGTTELLLVEPDRYNIQASCIGGTSDISAGQLIDRTGKMMGLSFPAGKALDALEQESRRDLSYKLRLNEFWFSLSGMENQAQALFRKGEAPEEVAHFVLRSIGLALCRVTRAAQEKYSGLPVLCSGGVASNRLLRKMLTEETGALFAQPEYASDNAMGIAILAARARQWEEKV